MWKVRLTDECEEWLFGLAEKEQIGLVARFEEIERQGPGLGRPLVDTVSGSRHSNMKELRYKQLRVLFAFDPERQAILLLGGDKYKKWQKWYRKAIPQADDLLDAHLKSLTGNKQDWN